MITAKRYTRYAANPAAFRADLAIDVDGTPRRFGDVMGTWQHDDFAALDAALMRCNGRSAAPATMRAYIERPRGHAKTSDLAVTCVWTLAFAARPIRAYAFAADGDQARLLRDAMHTIVRLNPWLANILDVQRNLVQNTAAGHPGAGGRLEILTSDVGSSYGILPDLIVADELVHWQGDGSLWNSILSSAAKRSNCLLVVISNAGFAESWQWRIREAARTDPRWYFGRLDGPAAAWLTPDTLAEQERLLPAVAYRRLWLNEWTTGGGDALDPADIDAAIQANLRRQTSALYGFEYVAGLDLAVSRDNAALCVLGVHHGEPPSVTAYVSQFHDVVEHGRIRLAHTVLWRPGKGRKINLQSIEDEVLRLHKVFQFNSVVVDAWQAVHMAQRLRLADVPVADIALTGSTLQRIATRVLEAFSDRRVELYRDADLERDISRFRIVEKSYGFRIVSPRDQTGHGDLGSAFQYAMLAATDLAGEPRLPAVGAAWGTWKDTNESPLQDEIREAAQMEAEIIAEHERTKESDRMVRERAAAAADARREYGWLFRD